MSETEKPAIAITMGDPCGIGPEVVVKALADPQVYASCRPVVVGNTYAMKEAVRLNGPVVFQEGCVSCVDGFCGWNKCD